VGREERSPRQGRHTTTRPSTTPSRLTTSDSAPEGVHGLATITASPLEPGNARPVSGDLALLGHPHRTQAPVCRGVHSPRARVAQPGHEPGHNHEGHAGTLAADASKDMHLPRPSRQGCPVVLGGRYPRLPARHVVTAARKAGTRSGMARSVPQALSVPLMPHRAVVAGLPRPGQGGTRGPRPPGAGYHCRRSGDPRWTTGSASAVPRVGRAAVLGPG
jgi:hypothetical protein